MTVAATVYDLAGRWRWGLHGHYVYLAQAADRTGPVKIGTTTNPDVRLVALQNGSPLPLVFAALLPGGQPHEHHLHRRFYTHRLSGEWFDDPAPILAYASQLHDALEAAATDDPRLALVAALRETDPDIAALERLWLNGAPYPILCELTGMEKHQVRRRLDALRAMGFVLPHRYAYRSRTRDSYEDDSIIVRRR